MGVGRRQKHQSPLWIAHDEIVHDRAPLLREAQRVAAGGRVQSALRNPVRPYDEGARSRAEVRGPGVYFRMHLVGFVEGIESERGWSGASPTRCPCASFWGSRSRSACRPLDGEPHAAAAPLAVHQAVFALILGIVEDKACSRGECSGSTPPTAGRCVDEGHRAAGYQREMRRQGDTACCRGKHYRRNSTTTTAQGVPMPSWRNGRVRGLRILCSRNHASVARSPSRGRPGAQRAASSPGDVRLPHPGSSWGGGVRHGRGAPDFLEGGTRRRW